MKISREQLTYEFLKELYEEHSKDPLATHTVLFDDIWSRVTDRFPDLDSDTASAAFNALYAGRWINQWNLDDGTKLSSLWAPSLWSKRSKS